MWEIGDKAYCIDNSNLDDLHFYPSGKIQRGRIYTVKSLMNENNFKLSLVEIPRYDEHLDPIGWEEKRFQKLPKNFSSTINNQ
jgi:hypothetical protein